MLFLGCDGGSSKTEFILADHEGNVFSHKIFPAYNFGRVGREAFSKSIQASLDMVLQEADVKPEDIVYGVFGLPAYGEIEAMEEAVPEILGSILPIERISVVNDSVIGWSGSLAGTPGINVVSGTGSIAYGEDESGNKSRVGGWSVLFGDEGSCSWIGKKVLTAFFKQADGRMKRSQLYEVFREYFQLTKKDIYFVEVICSGFEANRSNIAKLQLLAEKAYKLGDPNIQQMYDEAACELAEMVGTVKDNLAFSDMPVKVSYSGGLFKSGDLILKPLNERIRVMKMVLVKPLYPPYIGALAMGAKKYLNPEKLKIMLSGVYNTLNR